jgi:CDP-diacylglycerol--glycerol-3-phosphate 3-phosphatidyltransferase
MPGAYQLKPWFQGVLGGVARTLIRRRVHPDVLTGAALGLAMVGGAALITSRWAAPLLLLVPPLVLARTALNALDGMVARGSGLDRPWGTVLNELGDRLADIALFAGLALAPGAESRLGAATLVLLLLSSYAGTVAQAAGGQRQYGGIMGKADRMLVLGLAAPLAFALPGVPVLGGALWIVAAGLVVTILQRLGAAYADLRSAR